MDVAVDLVEAYLRLNGYFTLTEFDVQRRGRDGRYESVTDVDVVAVRFPGNVLAADSHTEPDAEFLLIEDEGLALEDGTVDVLIGEVKEGQAEFNPRLTDHDTLHTVLRRVAWLYLGGIEPVVRDLRLHRVSRGATHGSAAVRTRLVAFGRAAENTLNVISLTHILETMVGFFERFEQVLRPAQFKDPASALLRLLVKTGFSVSKDPSG